MHAPAAAQTMTSWRHPSGDARCYFNSQKAAEWIDDWNSRGNLESLNRLLCHARPLIESICEYRATTKHEELPELVQQIQIKLWRSLRLFDPARGTAFSFVARVVSSVSASIVNDCWKRNGRYVDLDAGLIGRLRSPAGEPYGVQHIEHLVRSIKTVCELAEELAAQRWLVLNFIDCGFRLRRFEMADSAMKVFNLTHARSRQLHNLTLLEIRRQVIGERRLTPIKVLDICHSKIAALERYAGLLNGEDFTRLCVLLRDLAPVVVFLVKPENTLRIRKGKRTPTLENLGLILNGDPAAKPLFAA